MWLDVFLIGWISMASIPVAKCEIAHCVYEKLCVFCNVKAVHYFVTVFDMAVCYFFFVPTTWMCCCQCINFFKGKTSYERAQRKYHLDEVPDAQVSLLKEQQNTGVASERGRSQPTRCIWAFNCKRMCCPKKTTSQFDLLDQYQKEASLSSASSMTSA